MWIFLLSSGRSWESFPPFFRNELMWRNVKHRNIHSHSFFFDRQRRYVDIYPAALSRYHERRILESSLLRSRSHSGEGSFHVKLFFFVLKAATGKVKRPSLSALYSSLRKCFPVEQRVGPLRRQWSRGTRREPKHESEVFPWQILRH